MARAQFQKGQKVWVESVGVWAQVEKVNPVWAKGFDEPVRITYDVGLGREFAGGELQLPTEDRAATALGDWRVLRARNKWQDAADCAHHPFPGSYPVVVTDKADWGGWRVPGAEYDRDPQRIEFQSRLIAAAPELMGLARELLASVAEAPEDAPPETVRLARQAQTMLRRITDVLAPPPEATRPAAREDVTLSETDA
ncbi:MULTISPECIES: hypothetical protein [Brevundimonas]|jgi:hypothetical protein|uniref:hypothetical protein n=1 Tax=Brevundimonas TaxID=41275 RepID=UPI001906C6F7|nr:MULTISPECIES: hypothetical protein [Brevundimonas]MBK1969149.1 hypothetical protein [Brevundimonas diminuta]MDA0744573.1 hypothetical protein [Pseudomonadota bacterium]MDM8353227.1 hypothetical protein [Brevundimonas diminuta]